MAGRGPVGIDALRWARTGALVRARGRGRVRVRARVGARFRARVRVRVSGRVLTRQRISTMPIPSYEVRCSSERCTAADARAPPG